MNGRQFFEKYSKLIDFIVKLQIRIPRKIRMMEFNRIRNRNGRVSMLRRYILLRTLAESVGKNVSVFPGVYFEHIENLRIGDNVSIHPMCYIDGEGGITIGDDVSIAHRTTILSSNHKYSDDSMSIKYQGMILDETIIHDNVWIGCSCTILAGSVINSGCVVGANSTVTGVINANSVAVGSPVREIKQRI